MTLRWDEGTKPKVVMDAQGNWATVTSSIERQGNGVVETYRPLLTPNGERLRLMALEFLRWRRKQLRWAAMAERMGNLESYRRHIGEAANASRRARECIAAARAEYTPEPQEASCG
jgi:hypothetical protein